MNELRPLLDEGATDLEAKLLRQARGQQPDPEAFARTLRALGVSGAIAAASATTATTASTTAAAGLKASGFPAFAKWLSVLVLVGVTGTGVARWFGPKHEDVASPTNVVLAPQPAAPEASASASIPPEAPEPVAATKAASEPAEPVGSEAPERRAPAPRPAEPAARSLAPEIALIDGARAALKANRPVETLALLDQYHRRFGEGRLAPEANYLRIQALIAKGDRASAQSLADRSFGDPQSPSARRVRTMLESGAGAGRK